MTYNFLRKEYMPLATTGSSLLIEDAEIIIYATGMLPENRLVWLFRPPALNSTPA